MSRPVSSLIPLPPSLRLRPATYGRNTHERGNGTRNRGKKRGQDRRRRRRCQKWVDERRARDIGMFFFKYFLLFYILLIVFYLQLYYTYERVTMRVETCQNVLTVIQGHDETRDVSRHVSTTTRATTERSGEDTGPKRRNRVSSFVPLVRVFFLFFFF